MTPLTGKAKAAGKNASAAKTKIIIVGGGIAGLAAAWQLQNRASWLAAEKEAGRHTELPDMDIEIHVYEASWRLGGKGASGRDGTGRIYEHGLHIWLGFYENAFAMMRQCYERVEDLGMGPGAKGDMALPHATFDDAFIPEQHIGVASKNRAGDFEVWSGYLPPMPGLPGTGFSAGGADTARDDSAAAQMERDRENPFTLAGYLARAIALTRSLIVSIIAEPMKESRPGDVRTSGGAMGIDESIELNLDPNPLGSPSATVERVTTALRNMVLVASAMLLQSITIIEVWLREFDQGQQWNSKVLDYLEAVATAVRRRLAEIANVDEHIRRKTEVIDLVMTVAVGMYKDKVLFSKQGLDCLNGSDCREWLLDHGATRSSVDSPFVIGLYDLAFAFADGDRSKPSLAAGQALRGVFRMFFTYRGSLVWRMRSGMGDSVFAPIYRVLKDSNVKFHFNHRLTEVEFNNDLDPKHDNNQVMRLSFAYPPGVPADGGLDKAGCWSHYGPAMPHQKKWARQDLHEGTDFSAVILAMGVDDFVAVCNRKDGKKNLFTALPHWEEMRKAVKTVGTRAAQTWINVSTGELGWKRQPVLISGLDPPFETWADMTSTLAAEAAWRSRYGVDPVTDRSVHYFCGVLPDEMVRRAILDALPHPKALEELSPAECEAVQAQLDLQLRSDLGTTLRKDMSAIWPSTAQKNQSNKPAQPPVYARVQSGTGKKVTVLAYVQANFLGSQRFTLSLPGTLEKRISPLDDSVKNMTIAGDWTACGFEESCVESAVMSGMLASHALTSYPPLEDIVGYDHP